MSATKFSVGALWSAGATVLRLGFTLPTPAPATPAPGPAAEQHNIVPAYFYPYEANDPDPTHINYWPRMCTQSRRGSIAIMNPANGPNPGHPADANYVKAIADCHNKGWLVIGYVSTSYGRRYLGSAIADVIEYRTNYPGLDGIFVDEMANNPADPAQVCDPRNPVFPPGCGNISRVINYYSMLYRSIKGPVGSKQPKTVVVGNPGVPSLQGSWQLAQPAQGMPNWPGPSADILNIIETPSIDYTAWTPPYWAVHQPASKISHIVYGANNIPATIKLSRSRNAGWVYVTDFPNTWNTLPTGW